MSKAIVTGGGGFIGSNLVDKLVEIYDKVIIIDNESADTHESFYWNSSAENHKLDITDYSRIESLFQDVDYVFHLAGLADIVPSIEQPETYFQSNVTSTLNLLTACRKYKIKKLVYSASASCYGIPKKFPTDEKCEIKTEYPYAFTKYEAENLSKYVNDCPIPVCIPLFVSV